MAGIGFRLKRLIAEETYAGWLRAHLYGAVISSGPWLLSICTLGSLALLSRAVLGGGEQAFFQSVVVYTYTFSLVTTGAVQMVVTRNLADALYLGRLATLITAYRWTLGTTALGHLALGAAFYALAPELPLGVRVAGPTLLVVVACTWMAMIFLGAAQDYASVVAAFFVGSALSVAAALGLGWAWGLTGYLAGFTAGQAATLFVLCARIEREFTGTEPPESSGLLRAFRRYPELVAAGLLYNAGMAADRVLFWSGPDGRRVASWFFASPYDAPVFLCYLSVVPALAVFLVSVETEFYDRYRAYYGMVTKHGTLRQVLEAKERMAAALREGLRRLLVVQAPVTLGLMAGAPWVAEAVGMERIQLAIFRQALVGAAVHALALFGTIVLLYFDRRRAAAEVSAVFFAANVAFTGVTLLVGPQLYGLGYPLAALLACAWAYRRLEQVMDDLEYVTFASQPMAPEGLPAQDR